jgi:hypothetical protein
MSLCGVSWRRIWEIHGRALKIVFNFYTKNVPLLFKAYLHVRFQETISHKAGTFKRIEIFFLFIKPPALLQNRTYM